MARLRGAQLAQGGHRAGRGVSPPNGLRAVATTSSQDKDVPQDGGGGSALSDGWCWQFIRRNYAN